MNFIILRTETWCSLYHYGAGNVPFVGYWTWHLEFGQRPQGKVDISSYSRTVEKWVKIH